MAAGELKAPTSVTLTRDELVEIILEARTDGYDSGYLAGRTAEAQDAQRRHIGRVHAETDADKILRNRARGV